MSAIRVLVADDSTVTRKIAIDLLNKNKINVVGEAQNGEETLEKIKSLSPDVVVMDIWMPKKNGLEVLKELSNQSQEKRPRFVIFSCLLDKDSEIALRCLRLGAVNCVCKSKEGLLHTEDFSDELIKAVREAYIAKIPVKFIKKEIIKNKISDALPALIVMGSSTGGPQVLEELIVNLPEDFNIPIVIIQHMPAGFTKSFAERLARLSKIKVKEVAVGDVLEPGFVYVAPGGNNIFLNGKIFSIDYSTQYRLQPSIDCFLISAAKQYKDKLVSIILSGMDGDGVVGAQAVRDNKGWVIVQDPKDCMISGMVNSLIEKKLPNETLNQNQILQKLVNLGG